MGFLASYAYLREGSPFLDFMVEMNRRQVPTMLDSGAFTLYKAKNKGGFLKSLTVDTYIDFCKKYSKHFTQYVQLDKIKDKEVSQQWLRKMYDAGLSPMPVFTVDDNEEDLDWFLNFNNRLCVAGNPTQNNGTWSIGNSSNYAAAKTAYMARLERFWRQSNGKAKLHGLSFTRGMAPMRSHCYSVDSSTWVNGQRFGELMMFDPLGGGMSFRHWKRFSDPLFKNLKPKEAAYLIKSGLKVKDLQKEENTTGIFSLPTLLTCDAWLQYASLARQKGVSYYFAVGNIEGVSCIAMAAKHSLGATGINLKNAIEEAPYVRELIKSKKKDGLVEWLVECFDCLKDSERYKGND